MGKNKTGVKQRSDFFFICQPSDDIPAKKLPLKFQDFVKGQTVVQCTTRTLYQGSKVLQNLWVKGSRFLEQNRMSTTKQGRNILPELFLRVRCYTHGQIIWQYNSQQLIRMIFSHCTGSRLAYYPNLSEQNSFWQICDTGGGIIIKEVLKNLK